jgi:hypothetical protein
VTTKSFRNALAFQAEASLCFQFLRSNVIGNESKAGKFAL